MDAELIGDLLNSRSERYAIVHAANRSQYEEALTQSGFDLILCDFNLPDFDGLSALSLAKEKYPDTPVVIVSGAIDAGEAGECLKAGATDYLLKQRLERLPSAVQRALEETKARKEREAAEARLRASEERFRLVWENATDGMRLTDAEGRIAAVNDAFCRIVGRPREEVEGRLMSELYAEPEQAHILATHQQRFAQRSVPAHLERCLTLWDGRVVWLEASNCFIETDPSRPLLLGIFRDITERKEVEETLQLSLREKTALLKEVHHRVKNNLQVITSLLRLEGGRSVEPAAKGVLKDMQGRIQAMALLHETLYRSGTFASVDLGAYLRQLASQTFRAINAWPGTIQLDLALDTLEVDMDQAIPCGLIVNELVSNSLKHGFPDGRAGAVCVDLQPFDADHVRLRVSDSGVGLPEDFAAKRGHSLGLQLVADLTRQLRGALEAGPGASFTVTFPRRFDAVTGATSGPK